jgi:outer membrane protein OmpA-like peptidoglycan-associated protein
MGTHTLSSSIFNRTRGFIFLKRNTTLNFTLLGLKNLPSTNPGGLMILPAFLVLLLCLTNLAGVASAQNSVTFSDYPRYGTDVNALPPDLQAGMKAFATGLVALALSGQSVDVTVIGHADFDAKGRAFEAEVSRQRAAGAENALETFFVQAANAVALPADRLKFVRFTAIGAGTLRPVHAKPVNEEQRKNNRRVELVVTTTAVPLPDP